MIEEKCPQVEEIPEGRAHWILVEIDEKRHICEHILMKFLNYNNQERNLKTSWKRTSYPFAWGRQWESNLHWTSHLLPNKLKHCGWNCGVPTAPHWELLRKAESQAPLQSYWISICILTRCLVIMNIEEEGSKRASTFEN